MGRLSSLLTGKPQFKEFKSPSELAQAKKPETITSGIRQSLDQAITSPKLSTLLKTETVTPDLESVKPLPTAPAYVGGRGKRGSNSPNITTRAGRAKLQSQELQKEQRQRASEVKAKETQRKKTLLGAEERLENLLSETRKIEESPEPDATAQTRLTEDILATRNLITANQHGFKSGLRESVFLQPTAKFGAQQATPERAEASQQALETAKTQKGFGTGRVVGELGKQAVLYATVGAALKGTELGQALSTQLGNKFGKAGTFAADQLVDLFVDTVIQTPQELKRGDTLGKIGINRLIDIGMNLGMGVGGEFLKSLKTADSAGFEKAVSALTPEEASKVRSALGADLQVPSTLKTDVPQIQALKGSGVSTQPQLGPTRQTLSTVVDKPVSKTPLTDILRNQETKTIAAGIDDQGFKLNIPIEEQKLRRTIDNSLMRSNLPDEVKSFFDDNPQTYKAITNEDTWNKAFDKVNSNPNEALDKLYSKEALESADDTAETIALLHNLSKTGNIEGAIDLATNFANKGTQGGRAIQAISMLAKTTPEGKLVDAVKVIEGIKKDLIENFPDAYKALEAQGKLPEITPEDFQFIKETMEKAQDLTGRPRDIEIAKVDQLITDKIPVSMGDKIRALRNLSLLGNVKTTLTRNPLGNVIFGGLENIAQIPSGITDAMVSKILKTGRQTSVIPNIVDQLKGFGKGAKESIEDIRLNIDTSPTRGGIELPRSRKVFEISWLNKANNWLGDALKLGDRPFYQAAYDSRLGELKRLGVKGTEEELDKLAQEFALQRVFQNQGTAADVLSTVKRGMNKAKVPGIDYGLGDIAMPYTQTPANILEKGLEYTPLNLINIGAKIGASGVESIGKKIGNPNLIKAGKYGVKNNQKAFTDAVGRMFTGTGIAALGYSLAKNGYITGKSQTKGKERALERQLGDQQYSIKIGDTWHSYDWAQPAAIPLAIGADFYNAGLKEDEFLEKIKKGTVSGGDTLFEQSLLRGITNLFGGQYGTPTEGVVETITNSPTQFVPTLSGQIGQFTDPVKREIDYSNVGEIIQRKIPTTRKKLLPQLDMFGQPVKEQDDRKGLERFFDVFINPSRKQKVTDDPTILEIQRLFESVGETGVIPSRLPNSIKDDKIMVRRFKETFGQAVKTELDNWFASDTYIDTDDETRAKLTEKLINRIYDQTKDELGL